MTPLFVHSWCLSRFRRGQQTFDKIIGNLRSRSFLLPEEPPHDENIRLVESFLQRMHEKQEANKPPWFTFFTNSINITEVLTKTLPVSFALSTATSVCAVTVDEMLRKFQANRGFIQGVDGDEDPMDVFRMSGLLIVRAASDPVFNAAKNSGRFYDIFSYRAFEKLPTLFVAALEGDDEHDIMSLFYGGVLYNMGKGTADLITRLSENQYYEIETPTIQIERIIL